MSLERDHNLHPGQRFVGGIVYPCYGGPRFFCSFFLPLYMGKLNQVKSWTPAGNYVLMTMYVPRVQPKIISTFWGMGAMIVSQLKKCEEYNWKCPELPNTVMFTVTRLQAEAIELSHS